MMTIFTPESYLSPEVMMRQIDVALGGSTIFTPASRLDPELMLRQIAVATGGTLTLGSRYDPVTLLRQVDAAVAGKSGGSYVAKAVRLDGTAWLSCPSLSCIDNTKFSWVGWFKSADSQGALAFTVDPNGNSSPSLGLNGFLDATEGHTTVFVSDSGYSNVEAMNSTGVFGGSTWKCQIGSIDVTTLGVGKIYNGDTDVTKDIPVVASGIGSAPFNIAVNGLQFIFGGDGFSGAIMEAADWRIMPGVSLLDGNGNIPEVTRRLFIDANGKPVDPAKATTALGAPGAVLLSGNATTFGNNQGSGGSFSWTGTPINSNSSPSD